jgi:hypothetical protein
MFKRNENATEGKFKTYRHSKETKVQPREVQNFIESQVCQVGISKLDLHAKLLFRIFCNHAKRAGTLGGKLTIILF